MLPEWIAALYRTVLDSSLRVALVAAIVALILMAFRIRSSGVRHAAWTAVLCAMLLMPALPYWIPSIALPVPVSEEKVETDTVFPQTFVPPENGLRSEVAMQAPVQKILQAPSAAEGPARRSVWPGIALALYAAGFLILISRLLLGWRSMARVARASAAVIINGGANLKLATFPIFESGQVATPVTAGVLSQCVILPMAWRQWSEEKLSAVLAHEFAHIQRRDPIIGLLAHLNRSIFWFHPLAWWLERKLAATAELACDEAAVRAIGEKRRYAEILLDMAETVRRNGGRIAWQGIGVNGNGLLGQRIDRILRGDILREISRTRKIVVAVGCAAAIFLVFACGQKEQPLAPLQEDPKLARQLAEEETRSEFYRAARAMNAQQVAELEAIVKKDPEDLVSLEKLLVFYGPVSEQVKGEKDKWAPICAQVIGEKECIAARRPHILWLIEHHPDNKLAGDWCARIYPTSLDPLSDPAGYAEAKKLWLRQTARPNAGVQILSNAANFFEAADKCLTEKMLLHAQALDPKPRRSSELGRLYALILVGSNSSMPLNVVRTTSPEDADSPYAQEIRKKLADSMDADLLTAAGQYLLFNARGRKVDFDPVALGKSYLERALQLNPQSVSAHGTLVRMRVGERNRHMFEMLRNVPSESQYQTVSALPEAERFSCLPELAELAYFEGEHADYYRHDKAAQTAAWERATKYAQDALALAPKFRSESYHGYAIYKANMILGTLALWRGDTTTAIRYLLDASKAPASEELAYYTAPCAERLVRYLLKGGERESVVQFLEAMAKTNVMQKDNILESVAALRRGQMPSWYQRTMLNPPEAGTQTR
jgi:beta-lactamase regulating signal transducer with metallopeptidase domain